MGTENSKAARMKIIVAVDFSELSNRAMQVAVNLARSAGTAELHLVHVLPPPVGVTEFAPLVDIGEQTLNARNQINALLDGLGGFNQLIPFSHVLVGNPQVLIPRLADDIEADLIVMGTHGRRGLDRAIFGSVAEHVVRNAPCSVLTVRPKAPSAAAAIEAPCADCQSAVARSEGKETQCARHAKRHARAHTYSEIPPSFGLGSMTFRF